MESSREICVVRFNLIALDTFEDSNPYCIRSNSDTLGGISESAESECSVVCPGRRGSGTEG
jgi:hypothetical protein